MERRARVAQGPPPRSVRTATGRRPSPAQWGSSRPALRHVGRAAVRPTPCGSGGGGGALALLPHRLLPCVPARAAQRTSGPNTPGPLSRRPPWVLLASGSGNGRGRAPPYPHPLPRRQPPGGIAPKRFFYKDPTDLVGGVVGQRAAQPGRLPGGVGREGVAALVGFEERLLGDPDRSTFPARRGLSRSRASRRRYSRKEPRSGPRLLWGGRLFISKRHVDGSPVGTILNDSCGPPPPQPHPQSSPLDGGRGCHLPAKADAGNRGGAAEKPQAQEMLLWRSVAAVAAAEKLRTSTSTRWRGLSPCRGRSRRSCPSTSRTSRPAASASTTRAPSRSPRS
jgi:hypothetical protein